MPSIYLKETTGSFFSREPGVKFNISKQTYKTSKLFKRYKHQPKGDTKLNSEPIKIYKDKNGNGSYVDLKPGPEYEGTILSHAHVYFNNQDKANKNPLVAVFFFRKGVGGTSKEQSRYYKLSDFDSDLTRGGKNINELPAYNKEDDILDYLIKENDNIPNILTYDIGKKQGDPPSSNEYNGAKITLKDDSTNVPKLSGTEFTGYKHTPARSVQKACVIFDGNVLLSKNGTNEVPKIQDQPYKCIRVYFGKKAKKTSLTNGGQQIEVPLLIELNKQGPSNEPEYYVHKKNPDDKKYYWENLPGTEGNGKVLCELLTDMGFSTSTGEPGYKELQRLLTSANGNGIVDGEDLSTKLNEVTGDKLKTLLGQNVGQGGSGSQKSFLELLLQKIEFDLLDSVVILLEENTAVTYNGVEVGGVVSQLDPPRDINRVNMNNGNNIQVKNSTEENGQCVKNYKYKLISHDFTSVISGLGGSGQSYVGIRFIMPSEKSNTEYKQLGLYSTIELQAEPQNLEYKYYQKNGEPGRNGDTNNQPKVYVWFYNGDDGTGKGDPRPLIICYGGNTYAPRTIGTYFTQWVKVNLNSGSAGFKDCGCSSAHVSDDKNNLLKELDKVVKFLNTVNLKAGTDARTGGDGQTHTYDVFTFKSKPIQIKVTCSPVGSDSPPPSGTCSTSPSPSCYKKFMHTPIGMQGDNSNGTGYRLGEVVYNGGVGSSRKGTLDYKSPDSKHPYHPLVGVSVFYYDKDEKYNDPLLIELEFKTNGGGGGAGPKEYYKLTQLGSADGSGLQWEKDPNAERSIGSDDDGDNNQKLISYLDSIRHSLKKHIKILIDKQEQYDLCLFNQPGGENGEYSNGNGGKQIEVKKYEGNGCTELKTAGYVCYEHKISGIENGFDYNQVGGLKFFISGKNGEGSSPSGGEKDIEIPLYGEDESPLFPITYNTCMKNIYVFFYSKKDGSTDTVPLMLRYNDKFYRPTERDKYFNKWSYEGVLDEFKKPCGSDNDEESEDGDYTLLTTMLDLTNEELNRIDLDCTKDGSCKSYGLPVPNAGKELSPEFKTDRVIVTCQEGPSKLTPQTTPIYKRVIHRTVNGFSFGEIHHKKQEIVENGGIQVDNTTKISIEDSGHTLFAEDNKPNTVVAYYSNSDSEHKLPQLIVLLHTPGPISEGQIQEPISATAGSKYGYYVLATKNGIGYQYEWRQPGDEQLALKDEKEFTLFNAIVILVDKQTQYQEHEISQAVTSATTVRSPGNLSGVNRLKHKTINIPKETSQILSGDPGKCVRQYGYKLYSHDITGLVEWKPTVEVSSQSSTISLIGGFRFLIPSSTSPNGYEEIKLYSDEASTGSIERLYHIPKSRNKVYVFFYGKDPRPLLLCYGDSAYIPKKKGEPTAEKQVDVDYTKWTRAASINQCTCLNGRISGNDDKIFNALLDVVSFLNPVQLNPLEIPAKVSRTITSTKPSNSLLPDQLNSAIYDLHKFTFNKTVRMKITRTNLNCYEKYTYEPAGISNNIAGDKIGKGFRLGKVLYHGTLTANPKGKVKYTGEPNGSTTNNSRCYQPLLQVDTYYYDRDTKYEDPLLVVLVFGKVGVGIDNVPKEYYKLKSRSANSMEWCKDETAEEKIRTNIVEYLDSIRYLLKKLVRIQIEKNTKCSYPLSGRSSGSKGGPFEPIDSSKKIEVEEPNDISCSNLKEKGYICFRHTITLLRSQDHHKIGGVVMTLPSKNGDNEAIEIPIYDSNDQAAGKGNGKPKELYYNSCLGDLTVYVYFYVITCGGPVDTVPLMLWYNDQWYKPNTRDEYLSKWVHEKELYKFTTPCGNGKLGKEDYKTLASKLEMVNRELNRIELTHKINDKPTSTYGIPPPKQTPNDLKFDLNRVKVTKIPSKPIDNRPYVKLVHRTINEFRIGEIWYEGNDITKNSIIIKKNGESNGNTIISVDRSKNHNLFVNENKKTNTVVVYFSDTDKEHKVPQLILLMSTDKVDYQPIASSTNNNKYGYYIINHSDGYCSHFKYYWIQPTEDPPPKTPLKLDDTTELSLLNSVVILLERKPKNGASSQKNGKYGETDISKAVQKAIDLKSLKPSPGLKNDINRLKNKEVTLKEEQGDPPESLLKTAGFKAITHNINSIVNHKINGTQDVTIIAVLRILIPTTHNDTYRLLKLYDNKTNLVNLYHQKGKDNICVYFYQEDPRPLLLCYNNSFRPKSIASYNAQVWFKATKIKNCVCNKTNSLKLLESVAHVCNFLNPVNIIKIPTGATKQKVYTIHEFNGKRIKILVKERTTESNNKFCFKGYTHTHIGIGEAPETGKGFRLGKIEYDNNCIKEKSNPRACINSLTRKSPQFEPALEVVVYYYQGDKSHRNPLLVALCKKVGGQNGVNTACTYQPYYELQKANTDPNETRMYKMFYPAIKLDEKENSQLEKALNKVRIHIGTTLRVLLNSRTNYQGILYKCKEGKLVKGKVEDSDSKSKVTTIANGKSESNLPAQTQVEVSEQKKCPQLTKSGYKCYKHYLVNADTEDTLISGLRLELYHGQDKPIELFEKCNQTNVGSCTSKIDPIAYTTCKGDLYVYFYGSDPRPLLLCYNGQAYRPTDLNTYDQKWCHVKTIESCECSEAGFTDQTLLKTLYQISMFLNPVKLSETIKAYQTAKVVIDQRKRDKETGEPVGKWPDHVYTVQTFGDRDIKMKVQAKDLISRRNPIGSRGLLRYKRMCELVLIMYYICIYVKIYTGKNNGK